MSEVEKPHYYGNRRYRLEVLKALTGRMTAEAEIHEAIDTALIYSKELERLGLDPLSIEEMLEVDDHPQADPQVFGCTFEDEASKHLCLKPVICDDVRPVNVRCSWHQLTVEEQAAKATDVAADAIGKMISVEHLTEDPPHPDRSKLAKVRHPELYTVLRRFNTQEEASEIALSNMSKVDGSVLGQMVANYRQHPGMTDKIADRADVETMRVVVEASLRELGQNWAGAPAGFEVAVRDLQRMLKNLKEGQPIETGVGE